MPSRTKGGITETVIKVDQMHSWCQGIQLAKRLTSFWEKLNILQKTFRGTCNMTLSSLSTLFWTGLWWLLGWVLQWETLPSLWVRQSLSQRTQGKNISLRKHLYFGYWATKTVVLNEKHYQLLWSKVWNRSHCIFAQSWRWKMKLKSTISFSWRWRRRRRRI